MKVKGKLHVGIRCAIFVQLGSKPSERHIGRPKPAICEASVSAATMTDILESSYRRTQSQPIGGMVVAIATFRLDLSRTTKNTTIKTSDNDSPAHDTVSGFTENKTI